ncbi:MAG: hypothetical protein E7547_02910 [Ruminococcaceae bacterium]|nr:hypothetical protein [Oscillospiraceae bacterium]
MYKITDTTLKSGVYNALTAQTREFCHRLSFGVGTGANFLKQIGFEKGITKIEISQEGNGDSSGLVLGGCCASSCIAEFYNPDKTCNYNGKTMFVECGVKYPFDVSYTEKSGYYHTPNGKFIETETIYSKVTNLIPVFEGDIFVYTGRGEDGAASVLWYDANKNFLSGAEYASDSGDHVTTVTVEPPAGAEWVRFQSFDYDSELTLEVSKSSEGFYYIPCGYYKVDKPETDDDWNTVKVTAYDGVDEMSGKWNTNLSMPSTAYLLIKEVADKYNFELDIGSAVLSTMQSRTVTESEALTLTSYTEREVCGFLAGLFGANARMNTVGKLAVKRYAYVPEDEFTVTADVQWQNGFKKTAENEFVINSITSGIDDAVFTAGTGRGISFANPIITEAEISEIYNIYAGASFQPSTCEWRGNPCVECGDTVYVTDKNGKSYTVFVASQDIDMTGGLSINTQCPGGDADISFDTVDERTRAALNKQKTELQKAIEKATDIITQTEGSIFELIPVNPDDPTQGNSGWKLYSAINKNVIMANSSGIGFSSDGGKTMNAAAIYIDENGQGHINANEVVFDNLTAGAIQTGVLKSIKGTAYFDLDNNLFQVGATDYYTQIASGAITQYAFGGALVGGLVPLGSSSERDISLYYNTYSSGEQKVTGVGIHARNPDKTYDLLARFNKEKALINTSLTISNGVITTENGNTFAGLTHTRTIERNNVVSSAKIKVGVGDWSDVYAPIDSKYMIYGGLIFKIYEGKPYYTSTLASTNSVPMTEWIDPKGSTALKISFYYNSWGYAFFDFVYKTKEQIGTSYYYVASDKFLKSTKGTLDQTEGYYSGEFAIPENAALIAIWAKPENAASNYWVGWRNVKGGLYLGAKFSASLQLSDSNDSILSRIDVIDSEGEACGALRIKTQSGTSSLLELGSSELWYDGVGILGKLSDLDDRLSALENQ